MHAPSELVILSSDHISGGVETRPRRGYHLICDLERVVDITLLGLAEPQPEAVTSTTKTTPAPATDSKQHLRHSQLCLLFNIPRPYNFLFSLNPFSLHSFFPSTSWYLEEALQSTGWSVRSHLASLRFTYFVLFKDRVSGSDP